MLALFHTVVQCATAFAITTGKRYTLFVFHLAEAFSQMYNTYRNNTFWSRAS